MTALYLNSMLAHHPWPLSTGPHQGKLRFNSMISGRQRKVTGVTSGSLDRGRRYFFESQLLTSCPTPSAL